MLLSSCSGSKVLFPAPSVDKKDKQKRLELRRLATGGVLVLKLLFISSFNPMWSKMFPAPSVDKRYK